MSNTANYHPLKEQHDTWHQVKDLFYVNRFVLNNKNLEYKVRRRRKAVDVKTVL